MEEEGKPIVTVPSTYQGFIHPNPVKSITGDSQSSRERYYGKCLCLTDYKKKVCGAFLQATQTFFKRYKSISYSLGSVSRPQRLAPGPTRSGSWSRCDRKSRI